ESQVRNAGILSSVKNALTKDYLEGLKSLDPELVKTAVTGERFQACFFENCQDKAILDFVNGVLGR
ncbi:MAG TPA: hypothetical protein VL987_02755, partial [Cellvibrio sp.]|nr:hypothetical protein [Cellvibrio sp.]